MKRRILILTECGSEIGFGHLTRCQSLANMFCKVGWEACLWVAVDEATSIKLPFGIAPINWHRLTCDVAAELRRTDAVVVDSQVVTDEQIEKLGELNPNIAIIDDWKRRVYRTGIVIDWTIGAENSAFTERSANVLYLLGSKYCALREAFQEAPQRHISEFPHSILVTFGGSDIRQLTVPVLSMLNDQFPLMHKDVVVGNGVRDKQIWQKIRYPLTTFHIACNASQMRLLMSKSDIAISAGGQTLYELASQGLPPLVIGVADDQQEDIQGFERGGFAISIGDWHNPSIFPLITSAVQTLWSAAERRRRSALGRKIVDGGGAQRVVAACLEHWQQK